MGASACHIVSSQWLWVRALLVTLTLPALHQTRQKLRLAPDASSEQLKCICAANVHLHTESLETVAAIVTKGYLDLVP